jgi:hypothetical protein
MYNKVLTHEGYSRGGIKWLRRLQYVSCNQLGYRVVVRGRGVPMSTLYSMLFCLGSYM